MQLETALCIGAASGHFVVKKWDENDVRMPSTILTNSTIDAYELANRVLKYDVKRFGTIRQVRFIDVDDNRKIVLYAIEIPEKVPINEEYDWISFNDYRDSEAFRLIMLSINWRINAD